MKSIYLDDGPCSRVKGFVMRDAQDLDPQCGGFVFDQ